MRQRWAASDFADRRGELLDDFSSSFDSPSETTEALRALCGARIKRAFGISDELLLARLTSGIILSDQSGGIVNKLLVFEAVGLLIDMGERNRARRLLDSHISADDPQDMQFRAAMYRQLIAMLPAYTAEGVAELHAEMELRSSADIPISEFERESQLIGWSFVALGRLALNEGEQAVEAYATLAALSNPAMLRDRRYAVTAYRGLARLFMEDAQLDAAGDFLQIAQMAATIPNRGHRDEIGQLKAGLALLDTKIRLKGGANIADLFPGEKRGDPEFGFIADFDLDFDGVTQAEREEMLNLYRDLYEARGGKDITRAPAIPDIPQLLALGFEQAQSLFVSDAEASVMLSSAIRQADTDEDRAALVLLDRSRRARLDLLRRYLDGGQPEGISGEATFVTQLQAIEQAIAGLDAVAWMIEEPGSDPQRWNSIHPWYLGMRQSNFEQLAEDFMLILPAGDDIHVFVQGHKNEQSFAWHRVVGGVARVRPLVERLRCQVDWRASCTYKAQQALEEIAETPLERAGQQGFDLAAAHQLYRLLIQPVEDALAPGSDVFVMARGAMSTLPLALLVTEDPGEITDWADYGIMRDAAWLGDRFAFTTAPSFESFRPNRFRNISSVSQNMLFAVANPDFTGTSQLGELRSVSFLESGRNGVLANLSVLRRLAPLPGTQEEYEMLVRTLDTSAQVSLLGVDANEAAVRRHPDLGRARYLLLATHGLLPKPGVAGLSEPALVLTPPREATFEDDGLLSSSEVERLALQAEWVILSACNTASGAGEGESLSRLASAFLRAGALQVLASHWSVRDDVTPILTSRTLHYATENPSVGPGRSLRAAMRELRTGRAADGTPLQNWKSEWSHPQSWAPFVVISNGDEAIVNDRFQLDNYADLPR